MWKILKYVFGFVFLITVLVTGFNFLKEVPLSLREREAVTNEWLDGLSEVYNGTHDAELWKLAERFQKHGLRAVPDGNGFNVERQPSDGDYFLIALDRGDTSTPWKELYKTRDFATTWFTAGDKNKPLTFVIVKTGKNLSPKTKGVLLGHELAHEKFGASKNICEDEVFAHTFSNRLWLELGGEPYQKLLDERAKEYGEYLLGQKTVVTSLSLYTDKLETILGKSVSFDERVIRSASFDYASIFLAVDAYYPGSDKIAEKAKLYCQVNPDDAKKQAGGSE
jgi:hypothetical protein